MLKNNLVYRQENSGTLWMRRAKRALALLTVVLVSGQPVGATEVTQKEPAIGEWMTSSFVGPDDGQTWHSVFYLAGIERPQMITRHSGLMIRCTPGPSNNNLKFAFAFGAVLRTNERGEIGVKVRLDGRSAGRLQLVTRNQANAEFPQFGAKPFLQRLLDANTLQFSARLSPKGSAEVALPLATGRALVQATLTRCGIDLAADVIAEQKRVPLNSRKAVASANDASDTNAASPLERALSAYLASNNTDELRASSEAVVKLKPSVSAVVTALRAPDALAPNARASLPAPGDEGVSVRDVAGVQMSFHIAVPAIKPPPEGLPLAIVLHGGVRRPAWRERERWWHDYPFNAALNDFLVVSPASWRDAYWWGGTQQRNLSELIAQMQRHYRVDASRVFVVGVSDGGAGALSFAMTKATPLAGVVSLIGHPGALFDANINSGPLPQLANLTQLPVFMVNGGVDPLMPLGSLTPWLESMRTLGVPLTSHIEPEMGHALEFSDRVNASLASFLRETRRVDAPSEFAWEAGVEQIPARYRWLVIEALQPEAPRGCVRATRRSDGGYRLQTEGVARLRVLLGHARERALQLAINPGASDSQAVRLQVNPSVATLMKWHSIDAGAASLVSSSHVLAITSNQIGLCQSARARTRVAELEAEALVEAVLDTAQEQQKRRRAQRAEELRLANSSARRRPRVRIRNDGDGIPDEGPRSSLPEVRRTQDDAD